MPPGLHPPAAAPAAGAPTRKNIMNSIIYLVGLVVIVLAILNLLGMA